ncbi:f-box-like domain-containing protein [Ditylenchus destructor]|nr:f-box-like domain-containing protein [Ditylenchus destructor]
MNENNMVRFLGIVKHCKDDIDPQTAQEKAAGGRNYMRKFILAKYSQDPGDSQEAKVFIDLSHAPDDILLAILNQLTQLPDLIRCTRVCRHWKYLIEETGCPSIQVLSRKTLLPLPVLGKHPLDEKACDQYDSTLFEVSPYITRKLMKILFTKLRKHLKVVSLDMISNYSERLEFKVNSLKQNLTPAEHSFSDSYLKKMTWDSELFFENLFDVDTTERTYPPLFKLDDEFVNIFRNMPNLKWLNLFNVEITKECLIRLADAVGDRLEALILGNDRYAVQPITPFIEEFIPKFTTLRYFALPLCYNEYCHPIAVLPYLPSTLVSLDIYGKFSIPIDSNIGQLSVICPNLKTLAINVHESVDMIELNKVAKGLET